MNEEAPSVVILGIPYDASSSAFRGPAEAPGRIRAVLTDGVNNVLSEDLVDAYGHDRVTDAGDLELANEPADLERIERRAAEAIADGARVLCLGGDHAITWPIVSAHAPQYKDLTILLIDAHPDLYDRLDGSRTSHACPFARIMERGLAKRLVQVGIRAMTPHQREQAERFGVEVYPMRDWRADLDLHLTGPLYLSVDLDGLDPAFAPGVSHHEPGGFSTRDVINIIQSIDVPLVGSDIVEYNPRHDVNDMTARVAGKLLREIVTRMLAGHT